jgi:N-acetylglutamate synthase-like GNAT family acetyltransferase
MIVIREIRQEDFECLLNNESLRSLITIDTGGANVFSLIVEDDNEIVAGLSGHVLKRSAIVKSLVFTQSKQKDIIKDGLYRALINKLDKEGVEYLFTDEIDPLLEGLGFKKLDKSNQDICLELKDQDDSDLDSLFWVAIKGYFD